MVHAKSLRMRLFPSLSVPFPPFLSFSVHIFIQLLKIKIYHVNFAQNLQSFCTSSSPLGLIEHEGLHPFLVFV